MSLDRTEHASVAADATKETTLKSAKAWRVDVTGAPQRLNRGHIQLEQHLEDWIDKDISIAVDDVLIIGRQVSTSWGTRLDLLGIDGNGDLVILELKRDQTLRDTIAQAIEYAAWASKLGYEEIIEIATAPSRFDSVEHFEEAFEARFQADLPLDLNSAQRIVIVAPSIDATSATVVEYLAETYRMPINAVYFDVFGEGPDDRIIVRLTVVDQPVVRPSPPGSKRAPARTIEEIRLLAEQNGCAEAFDTVLELRDVLPSLVCYQENFNLRGRALEGASYLAGVSVYPSRPTFQGVLDVAVGYSNLVRLFGHSEETVQAWVDELGSVFPQHPSTWKGWRRFGLSTPQQARDFVNRFRAFAGST